jgi:tRNA(Ile)-lysidine synthase
MGPDPALAEVRRAVRAAVAELPDGPLVVACSGGADSMALAAAVAFVAARDGRPAGMVTVDHQIQLGSDRRARQTAQLGYELGLDPVLMIAVDVGSDGGPENAARVARYGALDAVAAEAHGWLLLGHTRDDQAETVLLGLGRGSGARSLAGMRPRDGRRVRPLLDVSRETTRAACAALGLTFWDDPHNVDARYTRARLRAEALPLLEDILGGGVAAALARTATQLRDDGAALDELADRLAVGLEIVTVPSLDAMTLCAQPKAIRVRLLRLWARAAGTPSLTAEHYAGLDRLLSDWRGQGPVDLPGGYRVHRASGRLHISAP